MRTTTRKRSREGDGELQNNSFTSSMRSNASNRCLKRLALLSGSSSAPSVKVNVEPSNAFVLLDDAARLAAMRMAVRARLDLFVARAAVVEEVDDEVDERSGVVGADEEPISDVVTPMDSLGTSLSERWFRFRANAPCGIEEGSVAGSAEYSESERERVCLSRWTAVCFLDERSIRAVESVGTSGGSTDDDR